MTVDDVRRRHAARRLAAAVVITAIARRQRSVTIRKFVLPADSLDELVALDTVTPQAARLLEAVMASRPERRRGRRDTGGQADQRHLDG